MPNIWTHIIFAEELAKNTNLIVKEEYKNVFRLGAQGADPFFYYNFWPWKKDKSITLLGSKIHKEQCGLFLTEMLKYLKNNPSDDMLRYYIYGFVSHHILDRNAHPYIIYHSGEEGNKHQILETTIDTILLQEFYGLQAWKTPVYERINVGKELPESINHLLQHLIIQVYKIDPQDLEQIINKSYQDTVKALRVLYDPTGIKNKMLGKLISPFSHKEHFPKRDYLNTEHQEWQHPAIKEEKSTESFYDIWERAKNEGIRIFKGINGYLAESSSLIELQGLIGNISYETGKPCDQPLEMKYFNPIV